MCDCRRHWEDSPCTCKCDDHSPSEWVVTASEQQRRILWTEVTGGKLLMEACGSCGGLLIQFNSATIYDLDFGYVQVCPTCETPEEVADRIRHTIDPDICGDVACPGIVNCQDPDCTLIRNRKEAP